MIVETRSAIAGARVVLVKYEQGLDQISDGVFPHSRSSSCPCPYMAAHRKDLVFQFQVPER